MGILVARRKMNKGLGVNLFRVTVVSTSPQVEKMLVTGFFA